MKISDADLFAILGKALDTDPSAFTLQTRAEEIPEWDSMGHLSILVALDTRLGGKVAQIEEMASANSVEAIRDLLKRNQLLA
jgi:acyl carrier protein